MGKGSEEDIRVIVVTNGFAHGGELFAHISHVLEMSAYTVILPASGIPEPPHDIRGQSTRLLLVDPFECFPGPLDRLLAFDAGESGGRHAWSYDLPDYRLFLLPALWGFEAADLAVRGVRCRHGIVFDVSINVLRLQEPQDAVAVVDPI